MSTNRTLMIMAGGTGGHVYPALAVAEEMRARGMKAVLEDVMSEALFQGPELAGTTLRIDRDYVREALATVTAAPRTPRR